jgi:chaperone BCS1
MDPMFFLSSLVGGSGAMSRVIQNDFFVGGIVLMVLGALVACVHTCIREAYTSIYNRLVVTVQVKNSDEAFSWVLRWMSQKEQSRKARNLSAVCYYSRNDNMNNKPQLAFTPAPGNHIFRHKGHWVWLKRLVEKTNSPMNLSDKETITLSAVGCPVDVLKSICEEAMRFALEGEDGMISVFVPDRYEDFWRKALSKPKRSIQSVILDGDNRDKVVKDVESFLASKQWYEDKGLPYRRGFLFFGPPGCGKSSFLFALASQLDLNVCCLSLSESNLSDTTLNGLMRNVPARSAVLLEDIDSMFDQRDGSADKRSKVTFSGLLNAIDGIAAHEGRLLFMTTNHKEKLAPALIRPGRVDVQIFFGLATAAQVEGLFEAFYPKQEAIKKKFVAQIPVSFVSMARLQGHFLQHRDSAQSALDNVPELLNDAAKDSAQEGPSTSVTQTTEKAQQENEVKRAADGSVTDCSQ